ncbi:MAG: hypothetical protein CK538_06080 [Opitutia bacterium]|nr:MAG: hypothetical protein CK538_06080 [Opitutae bacterium]
MPAVSPQPRANTRKFFAPARSIRSLTGTGSPYAANSSTHPRDPGRPNTLILFLSANGGCAEPSTDAGGQPAERINDPAFAGNVSYGTGWANAANTPFRKFKSQLYAGGIATPLIVHWPAGLKTKPGSIDPTPGYLTDIMSTALAISGANYLSKHYDQPTVPLEARSLLPLFDTAPPPAPVAVFVHSRPSQCHPLARNPFNPYQGAFEA